MTSWFTTEIYRSAAWEANQHLVYSTRIRNIYIFLGASANTSGVSTGYAKRQDGDGDRGLVKPLGIFCYLLCLQCSIVVRQVTQTGTLPILHDRDVTNGKFTLVESNSSEPDPAIVAPFLFSSLFLGNYKRREH